MHFWIAVANALNDMWSDIKYICCAWLRRDKVRLASLRAKSQKRSYQLDIAH
ncbi:unnamed protein product [Periconia digitata]|uniref:Uncharacterized protein n=1 Tax=Periconia digitata TaxID=1303443 RepID=A0A9W4XZ55_9PLEO|nr:unnamed protein product [Periconia digitata]